MKRKTTLLILLGLSLVLMGVLRFSELQLFSPVLLTVGRFHPIVLHFPIVIILLHLVLEVLSLFSVFTISPNWRTIAFWASFGSLTLAFATGFLLYASGEYEGELMNQHFNGAIWTASLLVLGFVIHLLGNFAILKFIGAVLMTLVSVAILFTAHQGGSITHGKNYLSEYVPMITNSSELVNERNVANEMFNEVIHPILLAKCAACHNDLRKKGGFSVSSYQALLEKGESGKVALVAHEPAQSELLVRVLLPDSLDEHMPPAGKAQLNQDEISLIKYWISKGADKDMSLLTIDSDSVTQQIESIKPNLKQYRFNTAKSELSQLVLGRNLAKIADELEVVIKKDPESEGYILANTFPPAPFDSEKLEALKPYLDMFSKVSLVSSQLTDEDLYLISQMKNLKELYIQKTKITGQGLLQLSSLNNLKILNVSFTGVDDKALLDIMKFPALEELFVYSTNTSNEVIKVLDEYRPKLRIFAEEGPYL